MILLELFGQMEEKEDNGRYDPESDQTIVKKDDTFGEIAQQHGMTTAELQKLNPQIKNIAQIDVGDKINVQ